MGYRVVSLGDVIQLEDSKRQPLSSSERYNRSGVYPYYGAQGIVDYLDDYTYEGDYLLVAEDGENLRSRKQPIANAAHGRFRVNNHAHVIAATKCCNLIYLRHLLNSMDIAAYVTGSTQPKLSQTSLLNMKVELPEIDKQDAIAAFLHCFDAKIAANAKLNGYLAEQCEAAVELETGQLDTLSSLCSLATKKVDCRESDINTYVSTESLLPGKMGRRKASSLPQTGKVTAYQTGDTLISNIRPYFKKIWYADCAGTCSGDVLVFRAKHPEQAEYLYSCIRNDRFFDYVMKGSKGTKMPRGDKKQMLTYKIVSNPAAQTIDFLQTALRQVSITGKESNRLVSLRDALLPKLMSGEIDVSKIDLTQLNSHLAEKSINDIVRCAYQSHLSFNFSAYLTGRKILVCCREGVSDCEQLLPVFFFMHIGTCLFQR